ncbi:MAG: class A beta-lactamase-related serine hydrolase [Clostridiales bacterium]|jgi:hypothetical protein|nr:class A beta-lactamase-related serine hydrolase [Clostridiales bacterium]
MIMTEKRLIIIVIAVVVAFVAVFGLFLVALFQVRNVADVGEVSGGEPPPETSPAEITTQPPHEEPPEIIWPNAEEIEALEEFLSGLPYPVSVYYYNLDTGFNFGFRQDEVYFAASLNKASNAFYIYYLAERGLANLDRRHTFRASDWVGGTGVIRHLYSFGRAFSHWELLRHSVRDSDNIAFGILDSFYAEYNPSYREFSQGLDRDLSLLGTARTHSVTAAEMGLLLRHIHEFFESDSIYARHFQYSMFHSDVPMIVADYPVAQKYGHWDGAFHDMAIVYAPSPYILVILSDLDREAPFHIFEEISIIFQEFNNRHFR